jgi:glycine dehydrogenase subunit 1
VIQTSRGVEKVLRECRNRGLLAGVPLGRFDPRFDECLLIAVTEKRTKEEIDRLVDALRSV